MMENSDAIGLRKKTLRKKVRELKKSMRDDQRLQQSMNVLANLEAWKVFESATVIMMYWSMNDEVHTHDFVEKWYRPKKIFLPSVRGEEMVLKEYTGRHNLIAGDRYGIPEPSGPEYENRDDIELVVVPGVAFGRDLTRLGRGKAYYDKFLRMSNAKKAGICFAFQLFDSVPHEEHDIKMDKVISE